MPRVNPEVKSVHLLLWAQHVLHTFQQALAILSNLCSSSMRSDVLLPEWWIYPTQCGNGHAWAPGKVIVSWLPCQCVGGLRRDAPRQRAPEHLLPRAGVQQLVCYEPPHDPDLAAGLRASRTMLARGVPLCLWRSARSASVSAPSGSVRGVSLRSLARTVGLSPSLISQIETGKCRPSVSTLYAITTALGVSVEDVFEEQPADGKAETQTAAEVAQAVAEAGAGFPAPMGPHRWFIRGGARSSSWTRA